MKNSLPDLVNEIRKSRESAEVTAELLKELIQPLSQQVHNLTASIAKLQKAVISSDNALHHFHRRRVGRAMDELFDFVDAHMPNALYVGGNRKQIKRKALEAVSIEGIYMEFGVYKGDSIQFLSALAPDKTFHGFDSFEGLPETWSSGHTSSGNSIFFDKGAFRLDAIPQLEGNILLHPGLFQDALPVWCDRYPGDVAFLHIDCDLYSSSIYVLKTLADRIVPGTIVIFDEFFGYPEWKDGEYKAFMEFVAEFNIDFEYIYYTHENVVVKIL